MLRIPDKGYWELKCSMHVYTPPDFVLSPNVAIFSMMGTLIRQGKKKWYFGRGVVDMLKTIHENGASIVVLENSVDVRKEKPIFMEMAKAIDVPIVGMFIAKRNRFKKPYTHSIDLMEKIFGVEINRKKSLVCGNNAGRYKEGMYEGDASACDRAFAENAQIKFCTERLFTNNPERRWRWYCMSFEKRMKYLTDETPEPDILQHVTWKKNCMVMIVGPPSSGKHLLAARVIELWSEKGHIAKVDNPTPEKLDNCFDDGETILVVGCMPTRKERRRLIDVAAKRKVPVLIVHMTTPKDLCNLLGQIRVQTDRSPAGSRVVCNYRGLTRYFDILEPPSGDTYGSNILSPNLKYLQYPMVIRERPEFWFRF